jgi:glycine hydroxymethyltransferase
MSHFSTPLHQADAEVFAACHAELVRQHNQIEMIASENLASAAVMAAQGSVLTNKYAEGYSGRRYYGGCEEVDKVENLAIARACQLFDCAYANVQPNSGSQANQGVFLALLQPGDTILGMSMDAGGHLTHGAAPNMSGKWFNVVSYGVREGDFLIDYDQVQALALQHKPKMIIAGASAYPRQINWAKFREIADSVGAYLMADMAHYAGLIAANVYPSPLKHAHVATTTTHKTLRGPRGGMILSNDVDLGKKFNSAIFPGLQGGPLMHVIAGKAVAFGEALQPSFKQYGADVLANARVLANGLMQKNIKVVTDGTDSHMVLLDLRPQGLTGKFVSDELEKIGITCNKNGVPFDTTSPTVTSGVRLGSPAATSRGFGSAEFAEIADVLAAFLHDLAAGKSDVYEVYRQRTQKLCDAFPIYAATSAPQSV